MTVICGDFSQDENFDEPTCFGAPAGISLAALLLLSIFAEIERHARRAGR